VQEQKLLLEGEMIILVRNELLLIDCICCFHIDFIYNLYIPLERLQNWQTTTKDTNETSQRG